MRLTKKSDKLGYCLRHSSISSTKCWNKLGQIEDIEDELGMDILTFFKCLKATKIYAKDLGYAETDLYFLNGDDISKWGFDIYDGTIFFFKDCGKTWALTKKELGL